MDERQLQPDPAQHSEKKPYTPPCLTVHGSVQTVTAGATGQVTDQDGSMNLP